MFGDLVLFITIGAAIVSTALFVAGATMYYANKRTAQEVKPFVTLPVEPGDEQLRYFGYAPGTYQCLCYSCGEPRDGLAKGSSSCKACATRRYKDIIKGCAR